jgi:phosphatidate cytidylyltransferase
MLVKKELKKRIITSIVLLFLCATSILINKFIFYSALIIFSIICFYEWFYINKSYFKRNKKNIIYFQVPGFIYIVVFYISALTIYTEDGKFFLIYLILICASSDIGGYVFGKIIGGTKLTKISPKKTISGSAGSFVFSLIPLTFFEYSSYFFLNLDLSFKNISFCLVISLACQLGDLIISYFKRLNKIKDTGKILPGHGGLLDRVDGIVFAIPTSLFLLKIMSI